jgi:hypothetical protein
MRSATIAGLLLCALFASCSHKEEPAAATGKSSVIDTLPRSAITFILGTDENPRNPYYSLADAYYRLSDSEKTEIVIDTIYSLSGVLDYLAANRPRNGRPWGLINLVSHGNEFIDLSVTVTRYGPRVSEASIDQAIRDTLLRPLDSSIVDSRTLISLHGCAVGKNTGLLRQLGVAFGGSHPVRVHASKLFEYYGNISNSDNPKFIRHYYARAWYAYYHPDSTVTDEQFATVLRSRYPRESVRWEEAVSRYHPSNPSEEYNMRFIIPVVWQDFFEKREDLPDLRTKLRQDEWLRGKPEFQALMDKTGIPREYFQLKYYNASFTSDSGKVYAIRAKARAGVVCVVKPVLSADTTSRYPAYIPAANDTAFFGFSY